VGQNVRQNDGDEAWTRYSISDPEIIQVATKQQDYITQKCTNN